MYQAAPQKAMTRIRGLLQHGIGCKGHSTVQIYHNQERLSWLLEIMVGPNTTPQNQLVKWGLPPCSGHLLSDVGQGLFNNDNAEQILTFVQKQGTAREIIKEA